MRLLSKILFKIVKVVVMVAILGAFLRFGRPHIMKALGVPEAAQSVDLKKVHFSSEEGDLMATVMKSAFRLLSGQAKKEELAEELSDKLYGGKEDQDSMKELGIELVKKGGVPLHPESAGSGADSKQTPQTAQTAQTGQTTKAAASKQTTQSAKGAADSADADDDSTAESPTTKIRKAMLGKFWAKAAMNPELSLIPIVLIGMVVVQRIRRRRSLADEFMLPDLSATLPSSETENYTMKHTVHALSSEDFELLVARIYQRQGYRVEMPSGVSSGRGGDFMLLRKSERLLVQCKKLGSDQKVGVERVRELHDALVPAKATRGVYIASCGFSWDARNLAKAKGMTLINARALDALLTVTREKADEDLLAVSEWGPKFMTKVKLTPPVCPACEAPMDEVNASAGSVWVCSQRPDCRGRRNARKYQKGALAPSRSVEKEEAPAEEISPPAEKPCGEKQSPPPPAAAPAANSRRQVNEPNRTPSNTPTRSAAGRSTPKAPPSAPTKPAPAPARSTVPAGRSTVPPTQSPAPPTRSGPAPAKSAAPPTRTAAPPARSAAPPPRPSTPSKTNGFPAQPATPPSRPTATPSKPAAATPKPSGTPSHSTTARPKSPTPTAPAPSTKYRGAASSVTR